MQHNWKKAKNAIQNGEVCVVPTDTLYGIIASADDPEAVERIYQIKKRDRDKPPILLTASISQINPFISESLQQKADFLDAVWPGPVSVILSSQLDDLAYLHRDTHSLAFRIPDYAPLIELTEQNGPIIAPSANPQGSTPAHTIQAAKDYFHTQVTHYVDDGPKHGEPSTVIDTREDELSVVREGDFEIDCIKRVWQTKMPATDGH